LLGDFGKSKLLHFDRDECNQNALYSPPNRRATLPVACLSILCDLLAHSQRVTKHSPSAGDYHRSNNEDIIATKKTTRKDEFRTNLHPGTGPLLANKGREVVGRSSTDIYTGRYRFPLSRIVPLNRTDKQKEHISVSVGLRRVRSLELNAVLCCYWASQICSSTRQVDL
jgi:hypothetical protein